MSSSSSNLHTSSVTMSLKDYAESIKILIEEIESATNDFADENLMKQTPSSEIYKGRLMQSGEVINIVARICLLNETALNELSMLKDLRHKHIVPLFKIADTDDYDVVMIYKHEANESLDKHLSTLSWMHRLQICVGIARALKYLHYDAEENHSVIHGNIKSSKILLDHNWEPKLHGFRFAVRAKRNQIYLTHQYNCSLLYKDPAYETTRGLTNKSDVFSFGVVLFEVLFGMEASSVPVPTPDKNDNLYFARMARARYEEKTLDEKIDPNLREQMNSESLNVFSDTAYFCLKEKWSQRLNIKQVLQRLERAVELQYKHDQSLEHPDGILSNHLKVNNLDHLRIRLSDIRQATGEFSDTYLIGSGGYGMVYKAKLGHVDGISSSIATKGKNKAGFISEKHSTVAIKRLLRRVDGQAEEGFLTELELLSKCKHQNIVCLIGFCYEEQEMILIYEYASNGSLEDYLENSDKVTNLSWAQRIKICIDIAYGLEYLHKVTEDKKCMIHRDIKSANILLDDKWEAKIADFGLSKLHPTYDQRNTLLSQNIGDTEVYMDPEYRETGRLKTQSDIYSFGVVMHEIMSGTLAYNNMYKTTDLPSIARQCIDDRTIMKVVDPCLMEVDENFSELNEGLNQESLYTFSRIASQCVAKAQVDRPAIEVVIQELEKSLELQNKRKDNLHISLESIILSTQNFNECNCTGKGRFWKLYEGEISLANANRTTVFVKRFDSMYDQGNSQFVTELKVLIERKHMNIVGLVGYCNEMGEKIIVYEHACNGTLDKHLENTNLTWIKRLQIGLGVARGLKYLHTGGIAKDTQMIHRDIKSSSILLAGDCRAKLSNLEESSGAYEHKKIEHIDDDDAYGSLSYVDPDYKEDGYLTDKSDVYSLGVVLLEMLFGRLAWTDKCESNSESLVTLAKRWYPNYYILDEKIFEGIRKQITPRSLDAYSEMTFQCLSDEFYHRPNAHELVEQLTLALAYQEDYEMWQPKLPKDYEKLCEMSQTFCFRGKDVCHISDIENNVAGRIKDFHDMLSNGFLFQEGKAWFSLESNRKRNVMISAKQIYRRQRKWRSFPKSRFQVAAKMLDISNMNIRMKIKPQLLLPGDNYGVYLVFKFREPARKCVAKRIYVNLKYKMGKDNLHADFATWRDDEWMMTELGQMLNYEEDTYFEVLLESFSRCYCGTAVYIQGIEFRTIENASLNSPKDDTEGFSLKKVQNEKICFMLSEMGVPNNSSKSEPFHLKYSADSRFQAEIVLSKQQVFGLKGKIESQMLSPNTNYLCYLVFKLSEKCHGLHCPVKVRNVLQWKNKEIGLIYFRPPSPWNLPDTNGASKERADGWMEVLVWKFNSSSELRNNHIPMNLKFITYEGTMSSLIVSGLEIRPM